jgi:hypothetical protein
MQKTKANNKRESESAPIVESEVQETELQKAKRRLLAKQVSKAPPVKFSSNGSHNVMIEAVVTDARKTMVDGKKGAKVPKMNFTFLATRIFSSSKDAVVQTTAEGVAFGLPTKQLEASPEEIAKDSQAKGPLVVDITTPHDFATGYLGSFSASFYIEGGGIGIEDCVPGMRVQISGVSCAFSKTGDSLWTNAKKVVPLLEPFEQCDTAKVMVGEFSRPMVQLTAAFLLSSTMNGFFGSGHDLDETLKHQSDTCKQLWESFVANTAVKCDAVAAAISGDVDRKISADAMVAQAARIRAISPADAASGALLFTTHLKDNLATPYVAPIIQKGFEPGSEYGTAILNLYDDNINKRDSVPKSFVEGHVNQVECKGNLIQLGYRLRFVFDSDKAKEAIASGHDDWFLDSQTTVAAVKLSKRTLGPEVIGTVNDSKIEMFCEQVMPVMDHVALAHVFPHDPSSMDVKSFFSRTTGFDAVDGIRKAGVPISKEFIKEQMCESGTSHIFDGQTDVKTVDPLPGCGPIPTLAKAGYRAISEESWYLKDLEHDKEGRTDKTIKFFCIYGGSRDNNKRQPGVDMPVDVGEALLREVVSTEGKGGGDLKLFLKNDCLVYAVLLSNSLLRG